MFYLFLFHVSSNKREFTAILPKVCLMIVCCIAFCKSIQQLWSLSLLSQLCFRRNIQVNLFILVLLNCPAWMNKRWWYQIVIIRNIFIWFLLLYSKEFVTKSLLQFYIWRFEISLFSNSTLWLRSKNILTTLKNYRFYFVPYKKVNGKSRMWMWNDEWSTCVSKWPTLLWLLYSNTKKNRTIHNSILHVLLSMFRLVYMKSD